ncbi:MAG: hypothetical protein M1826_005238 [Phylliscum demangeonii]|nr:MAG: hypothetical protein M1826_005238 [Phylliscum demangeonii]
MTALEQDILDEYSTLLQNVNQLSAVLHQLGGRPTSAIVEGLRALERQTTVVGTLLKASVYSIVLQQEIGEGGDGEGGGGGGGGGRG